MKNNYISLFYILFLILDSSYGEVRADELIRYNMDEVTTSGTIIRHYKEGMDVVCYQLSYKAYFFTYKEGVATSHVLYVDMDTITDFEIYDDTVYFCGRRKNDIAGSAVLGYFDVASLFNPGVTNVAYMKVLSLETLNALEVGWFADRKHVVAVGMNPKNEAMVLDAIDELSYWNMNFAKMGSDTTVHLDLAITDGFVVVTSKMITWMWGGRLWFVKKPVLSGHSLFPCNVDYHDFHQGALLGVNCQIEAMDSDNFVTAFHSYWNVSGSNPFIVSYYNGTNYIKSVLFDELSDSRFYVGDIGYENNSRSVELLIYGENKTPTGPTYRSVIYEIPDINVLPSISTIQAHVFDGVYFESLDYTFTREHFVASGIKQPAPYSYSSPYYLKFKYNDFSGVCLGEKDNASKKIDIDYKIDDKTITKTNMNQVPDTKEEYKKEMWVGTQCMSMKNGNK